MYAEIYLACKMHSGMLLQDQSAAAALINVNLHVFMMHTAVWVHQTVSKVRHDHRTSLLLAI